MWHQCGVQVSDSEEALLEAVRVMARVPQRQQILYNSH